MTQDHSATLSQVESEVSRLLNLHEGPGALANVVALGGAAIPALEHLLRGPSQAVYHPRCWAADALAAIGGSQAIQALVRATRISRLRPRARSLASLAGAPPSDPQPL
jgi:hypothetical protein